MSTLRPESISTTIDFDKLEWHDSPIYAFSIDYATVDFSIDLDYILDWIPPTEPYGSYRHNISPATLVFHSATNLQLGISSAAEPLLIDSIGRTNPHPYRGTIYTEYDWFIECHNGRISLSSTGFTQYLRMAPVLSLMQRLERDARGGISFSRDSFDG